MLDPYWVKGFRSFRSGSPSVEPRIVPLLTGSSGLPDAMGGAAACRAEGGQGQIRQPWLSGSVGLRPSCLPELLTAARVRTKDAQAASDRRRCFHGQPIAPDAL